MKTSTRVVTCALLALTLLAAGCTKDEASPTPTTATSPTSSASTAASSDTSPTPTVSPSPSSSAAQQETLAAEATLQLKRSYAELVRIWRTDGGLGPKDKPTQVMTDTATGDALEGFTRTLRRLSEGKVVWKAGGYEFGPVKDVTATSNLPGAIVTLAVCVDGTGIKSTVGKEKDPSSGTKSLTTASYRREAGKLKMFQVTEKVDPTCGA